MKGAVQHEHCRVCKHLHMIHRINPGVSNRNPECHMGAGTGVWPAAVFPGSLQWENRSVILPQSKKGVKAMSWHLPRRALNLLESASSLDRL